MRWLTCTAILWLSVLPSAADILHLRDGSRYYGDLIRESPDQIVFRVMADSSTGIVRTFPRNSVARIERDERRTPVSDPGTRPEKPTEDFEQMYREALELFRDDDLRAALLALQRLVNRAPDETLDRIDSHVQHARGESLAQLLARLRMQQALDNRKGLFNLRYASRYEAPALAAELARLHDGLLEKHYHDRSLRDWIGQPKRYERLRPDAQEMVRELRILAGVIGSRLEIDRALRDDRPARTALADLRRGASQLITRIESIPGYTNLRAPDAAEDPTLAAARELASATTRPSEEDDDTADPEGQEPPLEEDETPPETQRDGPLPD